MKIRNENRQKKEKEEMHYWKGKLRRINKWRN